MNKSLGISNRPVESESAGARLEADLRRLILADQLAYDQAITSEITLAESYRISRNTVRKALQKLVDDGLLFKVRGRGTFAVPPQRRPRQTGATVGRVLVAIKNFRFLTPDNVYDRHLMLGALEQASRSGFKVEFADPEELDAARLLERAERGELAGIVWERVEEEFNALIAQLATRRMPQVTISRWVPGVHSIFFDVESSIADTMRFLSGIGHREIGMFDLASPLPIFQLRQKTFVAELKRMGIANPERHLALCEMVPLQTGNVFAAARDFTAVILPSFAVNNFMGWCSQAGLRIPDDISVIAISTQGSPELAREVPVSAITEPRYEIGQLALELIARMRRGETPAPASKVKGALLIKQTCCSPNHSR